MYNDPTFFDVYDTDHVKIGSINLEKPPRLVMVNEKFYTRRDDESDFYYVEVDPVTTKLY